MIGYFILMHHRPEALTELIEAIYSEEDAYIISIDGTADPAIRQAILWLQAFDNIRLVINRGVTWSGASMLDATLDGIRQLIDEFEHIKYIINISGECFPVKPRSELVDYLQRNSGKSFFLARELKGNVDSLIPKPLLASREFSPATSRPAPAGSELGVNVLDRPAEVLNRFGTRFIAEPWYYYLHSAAGRVLCFNEDMPAVGELHIRRPPDYFVRARKHFLNKYSSFYQKQWCVLSREFCEFVLNDELSFSIYDHVRNSRMPEESFFAIVIFNSRFRDQFVNRCLTFDEPAKRRVIDDGDIQKIDSGDYFLARKFTAASASTKAHYRKLLVSKRLPWPSGLAGGPPPQPEILPNLLRNQAAEWAFGRRYEQPLAVLSLAQSGAIVGYSHANETKWRLDEGGRTLEFRSDKGEITTAFSSFALSPNGKAYLFGESRKARGVVNYLESAISDHFQRIANLGDAVRRLRDLGRIHARTAEPGAGSEPFPGSTNGRDPDANSPEAGDAACAANAALPECAEYECVVDGRRIAAISAEGPTAHDGPDFWRADFGMLITNVPDVEFITLLQGFWDPEAGTLTLIGIARNFFGKLCPARLKGSDNGKGAGAPL